MKPYAPISKRQVCAAAFTLIELLITVAILALVLFPIYEFLRQGAMGWQTGEANTEVIQHARIALDMLCNDARHARQFYTVGPHQVRFWYQDSNNNDIADPEEIITFSWSGVPGEPLLHRRDSDAQPTPLALFVDDLLLTYHDRGGAVVMTAEQAYYLHARIRIKKIVQNHTYTATLVKATTARNRE